MAATNPMTVNGRACYMGVGGTVLTGNLAITKTALQTVGLKRETPVGRLKDGAGNTLSKGYARPVDTLTVKFAPVSVIGTNTFADAAANVLLPALGSIVTFADTGITSIDGDWNYDGSGSIDPDNGGPLTISLTVSREGALSGVNPTSLAATT